MIKGLFENTKNGSYPHNSDFYDFLIEYKQSLFTYLTIDCITNNKVERLKVGSIKGSLDDRRYKSNHQNSDFDDLPFDGDKRLISRR